MLPPKLQTQIDKELAPGEEIIWSRQARVLDEVPHFRTWIIMCCILSLGFFITMLFLSSKTQSNAPEDVNIIELMKYAAPVLAVVFILMPWWRFWEIRRTAYVITNQRVIWLQSVLIGSPTIHSITPEQLAMLKFVRFQNDTATIFFREVPRRNWGSPKVTQMLAFHQVPEADKIMELLSKLRDHSSISSAVQ